MSCGWPRRRSRPRSSTGCVPRRRPCRSALKPAGPRDGPGQVERPWRHAVRRSAGKTSTVCFAWNPPRPPTCGRWRPTCSGRAAGRPRSKGWPDAWGRWAAGWRLTPACCRCERPGWPLWRCTGWPAATRSAWPGHAIDCSKRLFHSGLRADQDLPSFLRFTGLAGHQRGRVLRQWLAQLGESAHRWAVRNAPGEASSEGRTGAYIDLFISFGLARLGESQASQQLLQRATAALERPGPGP